MKDQPPATTEDDTDGDTSGLASVVVVGPRDELAIICGRVDTAPTYAVVVHAPGGNRQLATELGIRRLQRHAEESGRAVAIATPSVSLATRARQARIPVARKPEGVRWDSGGRRVFRIGRKALLLPRLGGAIQVAVIALVLAVMAALALTLAPEATVTVIPPSDEVSDVFTVTASLERSSVDFETLQVPATRLSTTRRLTLAARATGRAVVGVDAAVATISVTNPGATAVQIPEGAILVARDDSRFVLVSAITVPAGKAVTVQARAASPGAGGNVTANSITSWADARFQSLTVTNPAAAAGGTSEEHIVVTDDDVAALEVLAREFANVGSAADLLVEASSGAAILSETAETTVTPISDASPPAGTAATAVFLDVEVTVSALAISNDTIEALARYTFGSRYPEGELLPGSVEAVETGPAQRLSDGAVRVELHVRALFARIQPSDVEDAVKGKSPGDAESTLRERYAIEDPEVDLSPGWAPWLPRFGSRIDVRFRSDGTQRSASPSTNDDNAASDAQPSPTPRN